MSDGEVQRKASHRKRSKSCKRCARRKQGCHGFPVCMNCAKAGERCEQSEFSLQIHRQSAVHDEASKRIQALEAQLRQVTAELASTRQRLSISSPSIEIPRIETKSSTPTRSQADETIYVAEDDSTQTSADRHAIPPFTNLGDRKDYGLLPQPLQEDVLDSTAVDVPVEANMEHIVQATVWTKALVLGPNGTPPFLPRLSSPQQFKSHLPDDELGIRILETYFERLHPRYPFLDRIEIYDLHTKRYTMTNSSTGERYGIFKLFMVYAIGATLLNLTDNYRGTPSPEDFFTAALQHMSAARQPHTIHNIEAMVLLVLYNLRSPWNSGIWYMVGLAMRTCIDIGLHEESYYDNLTAYRAHWNRRLFWTVYLLERIISISLRRPFSISEHDISAALPGASEEQAQADDISERLDEPSFSRNPCQEKDWALWCHYIRIKRLASQIQSEVYRADETKATRLAKVGPLLASLDAWKASLPPMSESEGDYMSMQWNSSVLLLLRPFLGSLRSSDPLIERCLLASGQVCDMFKQLHQRDSYGHSFISAHTIFIAGVTICYCIFVSPKLFNMTIFNSLRACSSTMFVMAERASAVKKHRDVLETVINRAMELVSRVSFPNNASRQSGIAGNQLSQPDMLAVQSLLGLSAQQDPSTIPTPDQMPRKRSQGEQGGRSVHRQKMFDDRPVVIDNDNGREFGRFPGPSSGFDAVLPGFTTMDRSNSGADSWAQKFGIETQVLQNADSCSWQMVDEMMFL